MTTTKKGAPLLSPEERARLEQIRASGLKYVDYQAETIASMAGTGIRVDVEYRYLVLNAASSALEYDDRARDALARNQEVRATLIVAVVATAATIVQAVAMVVDLVRG